MVCKGCQKAKAKLKNLVRSVQEIVPPNVPNVPSVQSRSEKIKARSVARIKRIAARNARILKRRG